MEQKKLIKDMKSKIKLIVGLLFVSVLCTFTSCRNSTECIGVVKVSMVDANGEKVYVPDCRLVFGEPTFSKDVYREVYTDENGKYEGVWKYEAYLKIEATATISNKRYKGSSFIRLSAGEKTEQEILIKRD